MMDKAYQHTLHEDQIYGLWEKSGAFNLDTQGNVTAEGKKHPFSIVMPPPNANDPLHIGHAMFVALEDILIRFHRMKGEPTLWLPGTDHAGIETQFVYEKKLKKEGLSRFQFDRQTLYDRIWKYVQENSDVAVDQLKHMGASADWSRFRFMLDPAVVKIVLETFQELFDKKLVYRDYRLVNYCTKCGTGFSELEVNHEDRIDSLYYIKYGPFTIATVRPETMFRDIALAVNGKDPHYTDWLDKTVEIPGPIGIMKMKVIADDGVDPAFGTGIMKVTPAHDHHDFELGQKYNLPVTPIINLHGKMDLSALIDSPEFAKLEPKFQERIQKYHGKKVAEARSLVVEDLQADGLIVKINDQYQHSVGTCYRCGTVIEPLPLPQFFIKVKPLTEPALKALAAGDVTVYGAGHDKILKHWLENLKDWNISRQIVWGIRMPVWYKIDKNIDISISFVDSKKERVTGKLGELLQTHTAAEIKAGLQELRAPIESKFIISLENPGDNYIQETDTFDTWFSSGQWPYTTLQSQPSADDFKNFYPTSVMETGYDILPFWVMRMLMMGLFKTNKVPFTSVYMHGLVRDANGQKMSKSKGNVINPLTIIEKFGADALRMALVIRSSAGLDKSVGEPDFKAMRNFTNKIWNAARFVQMMAAEKTLESTEPTETASITPAIDTSSADQAFIDHLNTIIQDVTQQLTDFRIGMAAETIYNEFWHWFCDQSIEQAKKGALSLTVLKKGLITFLQLMHPFIPFVTEALWQELRKEQKDDHNTPPLKSSLLITAEWPTAS